MYAVEVATNNYGKVADIVIKVFAVGVKSNQLEHYNKANKLEYAEIMQNKWNDGN
jgi:hypothetical protein